MAKLEPITATYAQIAYKDTYVSDLNPRKTATERGIEELAENIRQCGLINPLAGLTDEKGKTGIVAGGRRHRALGLLQDDPRFQLIPVHLATDEAAAQAWASAENANREALHPADEIRDFGDMAARGLPVATIAVAYGVTEQHVQRRLKLASLPVAVIDALQSDEISLSAAAAFTISDDEKLTLEVLEQAKGGHFNEHRIKSMLKPDSVTDTDRRAIFVGAEAYKAAGGRIGGDLFAEQSYFDDVVLLDTLFAAKLTQAATDAKASGWAWADCCDGSYLPWDELDNRKACRIYPTGEELTEAEAERYDELADLANGDVLDEDGQAELEALCAKYEGTFTEAERALAGVILYVDREGTLQTVEGLVLPAQKPAAIEAGLLQPSHHATAKDTPKDPISQALRTDLCRIAQGAKQHAILSDPDLILDLLAYQLSHAMLWNNPFGLSLDDVPNWPSTEGEGYCLDPRLTENPPRDTYQIKDFAASFRAFRKKGPEHSRAELTRFLASVYKGGDEKLAEYVAKETNPRIRDNWTPNAANFFGRVAGPYLNQLWCELLDLADDHPTATAFRKLKKGEKAAKLEALFSDADMRKAHNVTDAQAAKIDAWLPEGME